MRFTLAVFTISAFAWLAQGARPADGRCDVPVLRSAAAVTKAAFVDGKRNVPFELDCTVLLDSPSGLPDISVEDASGATILRKADRDEGLSFSAGDVLHVRGSVTEKPHGLPCVKISSYTRAGRKSIPLPPAVSCDDIESGKHDCRPVRIGGIVFPGSYSSRRFKGRGIGLVDPADITVSNARPTDPFDVAALNETTLLNPSAIQRLGRRKAVAIALRKHILKI